ncbi:MAG: hypothetical protein JXA81_15230 [Sedimentisphaerales bacterium]|nr:hypothetical protein [Sedimentisphaerales bacterium]
MSETEQWPLIRGIARVWPSDSGKGVFNMQCHYCLGIFESKDRRRCYCSQTCRNLMHNAARRKPKPEKTECPVCHRTFEPRQITQKYCSSPCRKLAWHRRKKGQPIDRGEHIHGNKNKEQQRARKLQENRYQHDEQHFLEAPLRPKHRHVDVLDPNELLPDAVVRRIEETLASQTPAKKD